MAEAIQRKAVAFELKKEPDADGVFEGYLSTFGNVDQGMDVIQRGAFTKSLGSGRKVKLLWQHDPTQPIGVWDELQEDERGLYGKGRIAKDVAKGAEAMSLLRMGAMDGISIGYRTIQAEREGNGAVRKLIEVDLFEASLVTFPMNELATVTDIKSIATERDFEAFLRDAGFSRKEATAIASHGFKAIAGQRDAAQDDAATEGANALFEQIRLLQEKISNV
jgi:HK97 family phage prohead protease